MFTDSGGVFALTLEDVIGMERQSMGGMGPFERRWLRGRPSTSERMRLLCDGVDSGLAKVVDGVICPIVRGGAASTFTTPVGQPAAAPTSFTAVGNTNVETNLWVPSIWTPIPANDMVAGKVYKIEYGGIFSTSSAAPTSLWTPRCGQSATPASNVTLGATTASTMIASLASVPFFGQFTLVIRSLGLAASGATGTGNGFVVIGGITTALGVVQSMGAAVPTTLDNTAATGIVISQTWGTQAAANTLTCQWATPVLSYN